jgi:hypothetical protein
MTVGAKKPATSIIRIQITNKIFFEFTIEIGFTLYGFDCEVAEVVPGLWK